MPIYSPSISLAQRPTIQEFEVTDIARELVGTGFYCLPLGGGSNPDVFRIEGGRGAGILKFFPEESQQAEFEVYGIQRAREAGLPAPAVIGSGVLETEAGKRPWFAMEEATGLPIQEANLSFGDKATVLSAIGRALADLHGSKHHAPEGLWRQSGTKEGKPTWTFDTWSDYLSNMKASLIEKTYQLEAAGLTPAEIDAILQNITEYREMAPSHTVFCHADLRQSHVYIDSELNITSVIDWGSCQANAPEREFSKPFAENDEALISSYAANTGCSRTELTDRIRRLQIAHIPALVIFNAEKGRRQDMLARVEDVRQVLSTTPA